MDAKRKQLGLTSYSEMMIAPLSSSGKIREAIISPDGSRLDFIRYDPSVSEHSLLVADIDGTSQKTVAVRKSPEYFSLEGTAWSPDNQFIICAAGQYNRGSQQYLSTFRLSDNSEKGIGSKPWYDIRGMAWATNGAGVVICARNRDGAEPRQLWWISLPHGEPKHITNDLNEYRGVSLANNLEKLLSVQSDTATGIWLAPGGDISLERQVSSGKQDGTSGLCWTTDHRLIYTSHLNGQIHLWIMKEDRTAAHPLTLEASRNEFPDVTPDGRFVVFCSNRSGTVNIWRMDLDGNNLIQLTRGDLDLDPVCTPDNQWVIYSSNPLKHRSLWKIPIQGGSTTSHRQNHGILCPLTQWAMGCLFVSSRRQQLNLDGCPSRPGHWKNRKYDAGYPQPSLAVDALASGWK